MSEYRQLVAEFVSRKLLTDESSITSLVKKDRKLGQVIKGWIDKTLALFGNKNAQERVFLERAKSLYSKALRQTQSQQVAATAAQQGQGRQVQAANAEPVKSTEATAAEPVSGSDASAGVGTAINTPEDLRQWTEEAYARGELTDEEYESNMDLYEQWQQERQTAGERKYSLESQTARGYVDRSLSGGYDFTKPFEQQLDDFESGIFPKTDTFLLGKTPKILTQVGLADVPLTMDQTHVGYALNGSYKGDQDRVSDHILTKENLAKIPELISDPVAIIQDKQLWQKKAAAYSVDVLIDMVINGKKTLVAVNVNSRGYVNGIEIDSNRIQTVHGNADAVQRLVNAINEDSDDNVALFYINKEKATEFLRPAGNPISSAAKELNGFIHSITDTGSSVKMRIANATQSQQFKRWFGDWQNHPQNASKIVNADGTPKVMYHGTRVENGEFYVFDEAKAVKKGGLGLRALGKGNYFTAKRLSGAERYGSRVIAAYLNIRNPFVYNGGSSFNEQAAQALNIGSNLDADVLQQKMRDRGYDGVVQYDSNGEISLAVTWDSAQIKSATENIGTFDRGNPNIKYSLSNGIADADNKYGVAGNEIAADDSRSETRDDEAVSKKDVVRDLQAILQRGGDAAELRRYVEQLERSGGKTEQKAVSAEQTGSEAEQILRSAKRRGVSVEQYLQENAELYEVDGQWNQDARKALELEKKGSRKWSVAESEGEAAEQAEGSERKNIRDGMPRKAADSLAAVERKLLFTFSDKLSVPRLAGREYLTPIIQEMCDEYLREGKISLETRQLLFEKAYSQAVVVDAEFYNQYKEIKDHLRSTAVTISDRDKADIADYGDFRKRAFGTVRR